VSSREHTHEPGILQSQVDRKCSGRLKNTSTFRSSKRNRISAMGIRKDNGPQRDAMNWHIKSTPKGVCISSVVQVMSKDITTNVRRSPPDLTTPHHTTPNHQHASNIPQIPTLTKLITETQHHASLN